MFMQNSWEIVVLGGGGGGVLPNVEILVLVTKLFISLSRRDRACTLSDGGFDRGLCPPTSPGKH